MDFCRCRKCSPIRRAGWLFIVDGDVHAEVIIVDDGEGPPVRQESQAFGLFDIPSLGTEVQDELFLSRYDFPVQAAVFEVSVIGDGRSAIQIDFVDEVLHDTVLFALFDHQELAMADGRDVAQLGGARVLIARIDRVGVHGRFFVSGSNSTIRVYFAVLAVFHRRSMGSG